MVVWLRMTQNATVGENSTVAYDFSGVGNNGSVLNAPSFNATGVVISDGAYVFTNSSNQTINITAQVGTNFSTEINYTLFAIVKVANNPGGNQFIVARNGEGTTTGFDLFVDSTGK